ncbi:MAG: hypothetical protein JWQ31_1083, partial [Mycobacterium sp.]|nr:hypothetical protein [Mycobacterium sp.]
VKLSCDTVASYNAANDAGPGEL